MKLSMESDGDFADGSAQTGLRDDGPGFSRGKGDGQESSDCPEAINLISDHARGSIDAPDGFEAHVVHIDKSLSDSLGISLIPCGDYLEGHFKVRQIGFDDFSCRL